jgi:hypothetical protein
MKQKPDFGIISVILFSFLFFAGCSLDIDDGSRVVKGEGPIVSKEFFLDSIESVIHIGVGETRITHGPVQKVFIRAQQNILDLISAQAEDDDFAWGFMEKISLDPATDSIIVEVQMTRDLERVRLIGIGDISVTLPAQETLNIDLSGYGNIKCYGITLGNAVIDLSGLGSCQVMVADTLFGILSGQGNVYYKGDPVNLMAITGNGNILDDN